MVIGNKPFDKDDLVRYGDLEIVVFDCFMVHDKWIVEGQELHSRNWLSTSSENCVFIDTSQINLFGTWE